MATILVVDDHTDIRENVAEILSLAGYETIEAENGKRAVELAKEHKPDLIVCDIMMPELDGYGVLHLLRKVPDTEHIPFIFLTAKTDRSDFRKGMELGADDYITKPFEDVELLTAVETRLKKQTLLQEKFKQSQQQSVSHLLQDWQSSGLLNLDPDSYSSTVLSKKQPVYREGKHPQYLYYVKSGKVKAYRMNDDGKEYITNLYGEGDYFGYVALIEDRPYDDNAEALENTEIALIPKEVFLEQLLNDVSVARTFIKRIASEVKEKEDRLLQLAYDSLRKRVASGLLSIHDKLHKEQGSSALIELSRDDIARFVGTATESLIRTLSDFKQEKLIEMQGTRIRIVQPDALRKLLY
ncbi:CRP-like cAMP-binding protein [Chitinophaga skermanii]|uniref:CRP-like cAMP-binding protein n=1 Tax=Chitinophaga skermanii TaxID=331697 RepID=A0A327R2B6_9BACT|nr:response regulator [Chitinophaga skermanii]RAJ10956.1 CRP-like cAMP-binding protein [Chitinophaga skermanii]